MKRRSLAYAEINLGALAGNIKRIKKTLRGKARFMAVVKANGYGHGSVDVSRAALGAGADCLGVASLKEALEIRNAGIRSPLLILSESEPDSAHDLVRAGVSQTVYTSRLAEALSRAAAKSGKKVSVHLKVDTGMGRVGVTVPEAAKLYGKMKELPGLNIDGIFTHFAIADDISSGYTAAQLETFRKVINEIGDGRVKHCANSAATLYYPETHMDMVRVGLAMYGLSPRRDGAAVDLEPALTFKTKVMFIKKVPAGTRLSYGSTHITDRETRIATLPVGYADGYSRALSNRGHVLIRGKRYPVVGRVCMDLTLVDIGKDKVEVGDEVVLIGAQGGEKVSADEIADIMGTINYEVVCGIGKRVERIYKK